MHCTPPALRASLLVWFLTFGASNAAEAQDIPRYDVEKQCEAQRNLLPPMALPDNPQANAVMQQGRAALMASMRRSCIVTEQVYYDSLTALWPQVTSTVRRRCIETPQVMAGEMSLTRTYAALFLCAARGHAERAGDVHFRW